MKVTIVGSGFYGSTTALRVAEADIVDEVVMVDIIEDKPQGLALDMMQSRPIERFETRIVGSNSYDATAGSDVCVITAGLPRKPGMSRMDLLETNAKIVGDVTRKLMEASPETVLIVVSNPLDEMTALAAALSGLPKNRVMGQAGLLDSARFRHFVAEKLGIPTHEVDAITLGSHGETMVPVPSLARVGARPLTEVLDAGEIDEIVRRTRDGGAEIVALLKTGSAYFAPAAAAETMVRAVADNTNEIHPVSAWVEGAYGIENVYVGVPAKIGREGVYEIVELELADEELAALRTAADAVRSKQEEVLGLLA
jgi:malate dehydrogenase